MSPAPPQRYRHQGDTEDPYTAELRAKFMAAVDEVCPKAATKLVEQAGPAFDALVEALDAEGVDEFWTLSSILEARFPGPSEVVPDAFPADHQGTPSEFINRPPEELEQSEEDELPKKPLSPKRGVAPPDPPKDLNADDQREWKDFFKRLADEGSQQWEKVRALARELKSELETWARPYNLHRDLWVLDHATHVLQVRRETGENEAPPELGIDFLWVSYQPPSSIPRPRCYRPESESRSMYQDYIQRYMDRIEEYMDRNELIRGWDKMPQRRKLHEHLHWLARFQVGGETQKEIVDTVDANRRNVQKAIKEMADLIGLERHSTA